MRVLVVWYTILSASSLDPGVALLFTFYKHCFDINLIL